MICLTDDTLSYLSEIIIDYNGCINLSQLVVSHKLKSIVNIVVNNKLKQNYKILIKDNNLINPLKSYYYIYKFYGSKFTIGYDKLEQLIRQSIYNNNIELIEIICKTNSNSIKTIKLNLKYCLINDGNSLWNFYVKVSNILNNYNNYILRQSNNDFLKFKELISNFTEKN